MIPPLREVHRAQLQVLDIRRTQRSRHLNEFILPAVLRDEVYGFVKFLGLNVHRRRRGVVRNLLRPLRLPVNKLLDEGAVPALRVRVLLSPFFCLVKLTKVREHLHCFVHAIRLREHLRSLVKLTLIRQRLSEVHLGWIPILNPFLTFINEFQVFQVSNTNEGLSRDGQVHPKQCRETKIAPVLLRHAKTRHRVCHVKIIYLHVVPHAH
mmetsp:Transcript_1224/g.4038  ORF Transcript_1224/g.4038 Transcript_1224/m.4038 type:complete len:209 (-) Transcript_1224:580-1206(-)